MSREAENALKQLMAYIEEHQDELSDDVNEDTLVQKFMEEFNASRSQGNVSVMPQTADDYLELAEDASSKQKKLEYLSKALELEPEHLDAARMAAELKAESPEALLLALSSLLEKGTAQMEKGGFFRDDMGDFWGVLETRPYMRLRHAHLEQLIGCGMMRRAAAEAEEMLRLCTADNLGVRYELMHLYAYLEDEDAALALQKQYDDYEESQMLLPLAVLFYKEEKFDRSLSYLQRLHQANKDTKKFLDAAAKDALDKYREQMGPYGYRLFSIEELICEYDENSYLFDSVGSFFGWASKALRKTRSRGSDLQ